MWYIYTKGWYCCWPDSSERGNISICRHEHGLWTFWVNFVGSDPVSLDCLATCQQAWGEEFWSCWPFQTCLPSLLLSSSPASSISTVAQAPLSLPLSLSLWTLFAPFLNGHSLLPLKLKLSLPYISLNLCDLCAPRTPKYSRHWIRDACLPHLADKAERWLFYHHFEAVLCCFCVVGWIRPEEMGLTHLGDCWLWRFFLFQTCLPSLLLSSPSPSASSISTVAKFFPSLSLSLSRGFSCCLSHGHSLPHLT